MKKLPKMSKESGILKEGIGYREQREQGRDRPPRYWEDDPGALHEAVKDACRIYEYRHLRDHLLNLSWKQARKRTLASGVLSNEWVCHGRGDVRLRRNGLEIRLRNGNKLLAWQKLQGLVNDDRS